MKKSEEWRTRAISLQDAADRFEEKATELRFEAAKMRETAWQCLDVSHEFEKSEEEAEAKAEAEAKTKQGRGENK
jgi:hypothetical protein